MKIKLYSFGRIKINGEEYTNDVIIFPDKVKSSWWRKEGHKLHVEDLKEVLAYDPNVLIIGTGNSGRMKVPDDLKNSLINRGYDVYVEKTKKAVNNFNNSKKEKTVAALHLTC